MKNPLVKAGSALFLLLMIAGFGWLVKQEYSRSLPSNVHLGELSLGGMKWEQAIIPVSSLMEKMQKRKYRLITDNGFAESYPAEKMGIFYDPEVVLSEIFQDSNLLNRLFSGAEAADTKSKVFQPFPVIDHRTLRETVEEFVYGQENDYHNAWMAWNDNQWSVGESLDARIVKDGEVERVVDQIIEWSDELEGHEFDATIAYEVVAPEITTEDLAELNQQIQAVVERPLVFVFGQEQDEVSLANSPHWFEIDTQDRSFRFNITFAQEWVEEYASSRDEEKGEVIVQSIDELVSEYDGKTFKKASFEGDFKHGKKISRDQILQGIVNAFSDIEAEREIVVEWEDIPPRVHSLVEGYQFPLLLSRGISSFRLGNHPNRVKNIDLSLGSFQGVIIEPGEEMSFNRVTGWITPRKGYTKTKVIMEGRVEEGVGGGVCQSSTTIYRSVLNAGLPVVERRNHTLDVSYYHAYGHGLDATVYTDSRNDFRFVNDFPGPILVNAYIDDVIDEAYVEMYGVTDEREVVLTPVPTGNFLLKRWEWKVVWPDREDIRSIISRYHLPKEEEEEEETNPLEA